MKFFDTKFRRSAPPEWLDSKVFYLGSANPIVTIRSRRRYSKSIKQIAGKLNFLLDQLENKINHLDIGSLNGVQSFLSGYSNYFNFYLSEPQYIELNKSTPVIEFKDGAYMINRGFWNREESKTLYITEHPGCSSLFLPSGPGAIFHASIRKNINRYSIVSKEVIPLIRIDQIFDPINLPIDLLKIDTQGSEFEIIEGMGEIRPQIIQCEVSTFEFYRGQKLLVDILKLLDSKGYFPIVLPSSTGHGDAIFVPKLNMIGLEIYKRNPIVNQVLLLIYGLPDYQKFSTDFFKSLVGTR
jgi:FkbM family methyltransferase